MTKDSGNDGVSPDGGPEIGTPVAAVTPRGVTRISRFTWRSLGRLAGKELRETLRDRRTIVTLLVMPLLLYPLLSLAFQRFLILYFDPPEATIRIGFVDKDDVANQDVEPFQRAMRLGGDIMDFYKPQTDEAAAPTDVPLDRLKGLAGAGAQPKFSANGGILECVESADFEADLNDQRIDVGVEVMEKDGVPVFHLSYHEALPNSLRGLRHVVERLRAINDEFGRRAMREIGKPGLAAEFERKSVSSQSLGGVQLAIVLPLILVLMTITGAVYPAIDLTAGERERGTLESLLATPVPRLALLIAKYIAVVVVAQLTAIMNILAMTLTVIGSGLAQYLFPGGQFSILIVFQILGLLFLFAAFFSAVLLVLTSMARSFKEAQAYLIPIMLISLTPGIVSLVPGVELEDWFYVPLLNMVLFARDLIEGSADARMGTLTVVTTLVYTATAAAIAAKIFGAGTVLYATDSSWKSWFRRPARFVDAPSLSGSLGGMLVLFPVFFNVSSLLGQLPLPSQREKLIVSGVATVFLFALFPLALCRFFRIRISTTFPVRPHPVGLLVAAIWGCSMWMFAHEILVISHRAGIVLLDAERFSQIEAMLAEWRTLPLFLLLLTQACAPAVCEEVFFRGYLFRGIQKETTPWLAWVVSSLLFGAFHVVSGNVLTLERFLPSALLGFCLGALRMRTGSILPGMLMHVVNNGLLLCVAYYRDDLMAVGFGLADREHLPTSWLLGAVVCLIVGSGMLAMTKQREE
jgi:sodium transport system permease protein